MEKKKDANIRIFLVINKGSNVLNQDGVGSVAGRSPSNLIAAEFLQPESNTEWDTCSSCTGSSTPQQSWTN